MSLSVETISCNKCDYERWDLQTWGLRQYELDNGLRLQLDWRLGWCNACHNIAAVEYIDLNVAKLNVDSAKSELDELSFQPNKLWAVLAKIFANKWWKRQHDIWLMYKDEYDSALDKVVLLQQRSSKARCLKCGSDNVQVPLRKRPMNRELKKFPQPTGTMHQDCGGELQIREDGTRFDVVPMLNVFTPEGLAIEGKAFDSRESPDEFDSNLRWARNYQIRHGGNQR